MERLFEEVQIIEGEYFEDVKLFIRLLGDFAGLLEAILQRGDINGEADVAIVELAKRHARDRIDYLMRRVSRERERRSFMEATMA